MGLELHSDSDNGGGGGVLVWPATIEDGLVGPFRVQQTYCQFLEEALFKQWYRIKSASFKETVSLMEDNAPSPASECSAAWLALARPPTFTSLNSLNILD